MPRTVGIDLGTTFSVIAYVDQVTGVPKCIEGPYGETLCPSVVNLDADGNIIVGAPASRRLLSQADRTLNSIKRLMGRSADDIRAELRNVPLRIDGKSQGGESQGGESQGAEDQGVARICLGDRACAPAEISAFILQELRMWAEVSLGESVSRAVITVPPYFNDAQRQATKEAGGLAGFDMLRLMSEPVAAAQAYGLHERKRRRVAVYHLGGGTFHISILALASKGEADAYRVLSTHGDTHLGGDDFDNVLLAVARGEIRIRHGIDLEKDPETTQLLRKALIRAKHELSLADRASVQVALPDRSLYVREISRAEFEGVVQPILDGSLELMGMALADARLAPAEIDELVLVGGSSRVPLVRRIVEQFFARRAHADINPDEVVALGAAMQAKILENEVTNVPASVNAANG
jgi:molecular chaperone DnaK (HSP70)